MNRKGQRAARTQPWQKSDKSTPWKSVPPWVKQTNKQTSKQTTTTLRTKYWLLRYSKKEAWKGPGKERAICGRHCFQRKGKALEEAISLSVREGSKQEIKSSELTKENQKIRKHINHHRTHHLSPFTKTTGCVSLEPKNLPKTFILTDIPLVLHIQQKVRHFKMTGNYHIISLYSYCKNKMKLRTKTF